ncbi:OmpA family protein [Sideroxydans sp. CL21]|uniref:OmpA family protein n=1 Tax=Sideroxydans sp. CL21 TaxID=2600596 RepID=UPI0024BC077B|nr:OmpA family protein [Sideroxydans sp. CL21]
MKKSIALSLLATFFAMVSMQAISATTAPNGYAVNSTGQIVTNNFGQCWHTGFWTPAMAIPGCDGVPANEGMPTSPKTTAPAPAPAVAVAAPAPVPAPAPAPKTIFTDKPITIEGANFDTGSAKLKSGAFGQLDTVVEFAAKYKDANLAVVGYTDNRGKEAANQVLSRERAESVKAYLTGKGVAASRITTDGKGSANPVGDNGTAAGRAQNRRVEINSVEHVAQ